MNIDSEFGQNAIELAGAKVRIDLDALVANWKHLNSLFTGKTCGATVKANAYGVGAEKVAGSLHSAGCGTFFVALPFEGRQVRNAAPDSEIFVLNGLLPGQSEYYFANNLIPVIASVQEFEEWAEFARLKHTVLRYSIHVDTGMNRLGFSPALFQNLIERFKTESKLQPALLLTHLACADDQENQLNSEQHQVFSNLREMLPAVPASMCNSAGIFLGDSFHFDVARPGIAIYGARAVLEKTNPMKAVATLLARILQVRTVEKGSSIGYGATCILQRESRIATVSCGYADGYPRSVASAFDGQKPFASINGCKAPIMGRISMDQIQLDVSDIPDDCCKVGEFAELFGPNVPIDDVANWAGTIGYELLTGIGSRVSRIYI